jgi:hypothetical protein
MIYLNHVLAIGIDGKPIDKAIDDFRDLRNATEDASGKNDEEYDADFKLRHYKTLNNTTMRVYMMNTLKEHSPPGIQKVANLWAHKIFWADYYMPPREWRGLDHKQAKANYANALWACFNALLAKLRAKKELKDEPAFIAHFEDLMARYMKRPEPPDYKKVLKDGRLIRIPVDKSASAKSNMTAKTKPKAKKARA